MCDLSDFGLAALGATFTGFGSFPCDCVLGAVAGRVSALALAVGGAVGMRLTSRVVNSAGGQEYGFTRCCNALSR